MASTNNQNTTPEYKHCAGKGCKKRGTNYLRIRFLKKFGWFCDSCKEFLIQDKLIDKANELDKTWKVYEHKLLPRDE